MMIRPSRSERSARRDAKRERQLNIQIVLPTKKQEEKKDFKKPIMTKREEDLLKFLNDYYISYRREYISQYTNKEGVASYATNKRPLGDSMVLRHLRKEATIGVLSGLSGSKFITFDIDYNEEVEEVMLQKAQNMTETVISTLRNEFGLNDDEFLVSFSGSKGYHVDVFFEKMVSLNKLERFYNTMLRVVEATTSEIELRPTSGQAVKLPLSINHKTGNECAIVDKDYFNDLDRIAVLETKKIDFARIEEAVEELEDFFPNVLKDKQEISNQKEGESTHDNDFTENLGMDELAMVVRAGHLVEGGSRHRVTLSIATKFNIEGRKQEDAIDLAWSLVSNTFSKHRALLDRSWTLDTLKKETERIVNLAYQNDYRVSTEARKVFLTKEDVLFITNAKTQKQRDMLMIMVVHAKKYADEEGMFYLTHSQMANYGAAKNRSSTKKYYEALQEQELIEVVSQNQYSGRRKEINGQIIAVKDPNIFALMYDVSIGEQQEDGLEVEEFNTKDFKEIVMHFLSAEEIKEALSTNTYYKHYSKCFK